ncbi:hypothetical protein Pst134EA_007292 [Puccinia striiformis f. sp. tritici]|uniref:hypothetical protein n=1 Tax=Puccinia striiformis f. sp. tritici TaxID=168172 RepID=UPI002008A615|nr:hypothetical protein Pst134EA_007292 [Puccinia striiformis f. sp. tritici]KAH9470028.1 hypothetical protein Pst134EA_007292 [Puccinia striiformis f. sp. tritici]
MAELSPANRNRTGSLTASAKRTSPVRQKKKQAFNQSIKARPVRNLPGTQRVAVVIPIPSNRPRNDTQSKKKNKILPSSNSVPNLAMPSRKRTCPYPVDTFESDQQAEIVPRLRKKTRQSGPLLSPAPTSPILATQQDSDSSDDELLLRRSTNTKTISKNKPLQLPSPTSSHTEFPVRTRAKTRSLTRRDEQEQVVPSSTPVKPRSKKTISQTAPVNRVLIDHSANDNQPTPRTRGRPRQRPLSPSPSFNRSPENNKSTAHAQLCGTGSDSDDDQTTPAPPHQSKPSYSRSLLLSLNRGNHSVKSIVCRSPPNGPVGTPRGAPFVPLGKKQTVSSQAETRAVSPHQLMIPHDSPTKSNRNVLFKQKARIIPTQENEDSIVSGVDERCFEVLRAAHLVDKSDQSDDEEEQPSETDDDLVAEELSRQLLADTNRSPRRLSSVSPMEISSLTTNRMRRITRHTEQPKTVNSPPKPTTTKTKLASPPKPTTVKKVSSPAKVVLDKDGFESSIALPYLHDLLHHLSGVKHLPIRIPEANSDALKPNSSQIFAILDQTPCLVGHEDLEIELRSILFRTVSQQEGNVLLLSGARGSGKTAVVSRSISLLSHPQICGTDSFITIKLNGLIHNSDKVALKEMCRQLFSSLASSKDTEQKRRLDQVNKELDTRQEDSSDECEAEEEDDDDVFRGGVRRATPSSDQPKFTNYGEVLKNLLDVLEPSSSLSSDPDQKNKSNNSKALVIILEEFDLFSDLDRQAFLYCLLDSVQGNKRKNGICVIGTTSVVDCLDKLEKRVKSRCQSRIRYLHSPRTEIERLELITSLLELPVPSSVEPHKSLDQKRKTFVSKWNELLTSFLEDKHTRDWLASKFMLINDPLVQILQDLNGMVSMIAYQAKRTGQLKFPVLNPIELFPTRATGAGARLAKPMTMRSTTSISTSLPWWSNALSIAEYSVLIACKHLTSSHHNGIFNLEMAWDIYRSHLKRLSLLYGRDAFELAWERLQKLELILPIETLNSRAAAMGKKKKASVTLGKRYELVKLVPFLSQIDSVILGSSSNSNALPKSVSLIILSIKEIAVNSCQEYVYVVHITHDKKQ